MSVIVVGLNHHTAPVELLERVAVPAQQLEKALESLAKHEHLAEVVLLSTCNRTEVYARCRRFHPAVQDIRHFLADHASAHPDELADHVYTYHDDAAIAHLFGVSAGVDSMIVGESEILGQVREAWAAAQRLRTATQLLGPVFRHALEVGKRARTETGIGRHAASVSSAAVALAGERLGSLGGRRILVLGAGEVAQGMAVALSGAGVGEIVVANRTVARAAELADRVGGRAVGLDDVPDELAVADVLLSSTGATGLVLDRGEMEGVMARRDGKALLVVDVAVPRDVDPGVRTVFGVTLLDMDDLKAFVEHSLAQREREVVKVRRIITDELDRFRAERTAREVAPLVTALRARAEEIRRAELDRHRSKLEGLDDGERRAVEALTRGIVNKLLHDPTVRVKESAGTARGELYADALGTLFDLSSEPAADAAD
ncbi:MAG: glutamyl-tRNA reductase [Acidimicrobiia bacterium]|nr:glutamyl-tRNA reductase [Acidimicrobiia bacterium]